MLNIARIRLEGDNAAQCILETVKLDGHISEIGGRAIGVFEGFCDLVAQLCPVMLACLVSKATASQKGVPIAAMKSPTLKPKAGMVH